jgi:hypothetical protein
LLLPPRIRKLVLGLHLIVSVGWIGAVAVYLAFGVAAVSSGDTSTIRAAWTAMELTGWYVCMPLAAGSLVTGVGMSLGTKWGLFRHYWVLISLLLTAVCVVILLLHMPSVSTTADLAQTAEGPALEALGGDLLHPSAGLVVLLAVHFLNVYKPAGLTRYGWRRTRDPY